MSSDGWIFACSNNFKRLRSNPYSLGFLRRPLNRQKVERSIDFSLGFGCVSIRAPAPPLQRLSQMDRWLSSAAV